MKIGFGMAILLVAAPPLLAHDFWIQPQRFQIAAGAPLPLTFQVGHGKARDRWGNNDRIVTVASHFGGKRTDLRPSLRRDGAADLVVRFPVPGLHVVAMQSNNAFSELPAGRFNDYAKEEGLALIAAVRQRDGTSGKAGRERYSRRAKALIQVGRPTPANQAQATRPIGLTLEIVPERNPYFLGADRMLPARILYKGRPLSGATVKLTNLANDERPVATAVTDRAGRVRFRVPATGKWQANVVWGEPVRGDPKADFETIFSSLTFGYAR